MKIMIDARATSLKDTLINVVNMTAYHKFWISIHCCYQNIKWLLCETWVDPLSAVSVLLWLFINAAWLLLLIGGLTENYIHN